MCSVEFKSTTELWREISNNVVCATSKVSDQPAHTHSLIRAFTGIKLLTENYLEILNLKGGCTGSSESIHVIMPHCWKSHVAAHLFWGQVLHKLILFKNKIFRNTIRKAICLDPAISWKTVLKIRGILYFGLCVCNKLKNSNYIYSAGKVFNTS